MRIVSLNAWGGAVWDALADWVPRIGADVLLLQEVIRAPQPSPDWLVYADAYRRLDQRADLFRDICALLPDHGGHFAAAARGPLQSADGRVYRSEHGIGAWVAPHLALTELVQNFAHGGFRPDGWGPEPVPRALQTLRIWEPDTDRFVTIGHLHGLRDPAGKGDTPARAAQARRVGAALSAMARPDDAVVLAGDLNLLPESESFGIWAEIGLQDLITRFGITDTRTALYSKHPRFADYVLVNSNAKVARFDVPAQPELSDHRPLVLDI